MSYGDPGTEGAHRWALADDDAQPFFAQAVELGITFWDTANDYRRPSEEVTGRAIRRYSRREDIVLATKVFGKMHGGPGGSGLSRKAIMEQIDASLARLGTDYVDLYQIHRFDPATPDRRDHGGPARRGPGRQGPGGKGGGRNGAGRRPGASSRVQATTSCRPSTRPWTSPCGRARQIALVRPAVSAPIVNATKPHHLPEAIAALELKLTDDEAAALEKPYRHHGPSWY